MCLFRMTFKLTDNCCAHETSDTLSKISYAIFTFGYLPLDTVHVREQNVRIRGYFAKPKGGPRAKSLENITLCRCLLKGGTQTVV